MTDHNEHRDRRGLLRNRRSIAVGPEGLTIRPWIGRARRLSWGECASFDWISSRRAWLGLHDRGGIGLDDGVERLDELVAAMAARFAGVSPSDIRRWLGPEHDIEVLCQEWERLDDLRASGVEANLIQLAGLGVAAVFVALGMLAASDLLPASGLSMWLIAMPVLVIIALMAWGLLMAALDGVWRRLTAVETGPPWVVRARHTGCTVTRAGQPTQSFLWSEVRELRYWPRCTVRLEDGRVVELPRCDELSRLEEVLRHVADCHSNMRIGPRPAADRGLSPAERPCAGADRGLSR